MENRVTTHILDTSLGKPAAGVTCRLEKASDGKWELVGEEKTNADGRAVGLCAKEVAEGVYRLTFETQSYFSSKNQTSLYPFITVVFQIAKGERYHIPLLLNPFGYSTYRGS